MKKAVISGMQRAGLVEAPQPQPKANWALVKVHVAPMCTEYKGFVAGQPRDFLGHEAAGEVVAVAQPGRVQAGDRVVVMPQYPCGSCVLCLAGDYIHCQHGYDFGAFTGSEEGRATMAQYLLKPDWLLPKIPDGVSYERAGLACCALGATFGALQAMNVSAFDTLLITGAGPVGLGALTHARFRGAQTIVVESNPWRMERARAMGAMAVIDPGSDDPAGQIKDLNRGGGVDCAVECSGTVPAQRLCLEATRRRGRVAFVGECHDDLALRISLDMIRTGLTLIGSWHYNLNYFPQVMQIIQESPLLDLLVSHVLPLSKIQTAFELQATGQCAKIILKPWA